MEIIIIPLLAAILISYLIISKLDLRSRRIKREAEAALDKPPSPDRFTDLDSISEYYRFVPQTNLNADEITWNDLDMDDIFERLNTCESSVGEEYLFALLHRRPDEAEEAEFRSVMKRLENDRDLRVKVCTVLRTLGISDCNGTARKCFGGSDFEKLPHEKLYSILPFLPFAVVGIFLPLKLFIPLAIGLIAAVIFNMYVYYSANRKAVFLVGSMQYLCKILYCARGLGLLCPEEKAFAELTELFKPFAPAARRISKIGGSSSNDVLADIFDSYVKAITFRDLRYYCFVRRLISDKKDVLRKLYDKVGMIDSVCAVLNFRGSIPAFCEPEFTEERKVSAEKLVHPLIENAVSNSFDLNGNVLITGSNASGKSSFVKAMSINALLAQSIFTCTAGKFTLKRCRVITSMAVRDDICAGDSYFVAEIKSMHRIVAAAESEFCLCAIDEILKGTNTVERIAASVSILNAMAETESLCIAATHDIELTVMLDGTYRNVHFSEHIKDDGVHFDYKIKNGPTRTRNAIKLLKINGFSEKIIASAEQLAAELEKEKSAEAAPIYK